MNKRVLKHIDLPLVLSTFCILILSLVMISSATHVTGNDAKSFMYVERQGIFTIIDICLVIFLLNFDYKTLAGHGHKLYILNLIMLIAVIVAGHSALGAQRWISIGPVNVQPSEFSKLIMIISMAALLKNKVGKLNTWRDLIPIAVYIGIPFILVLKQPDLGTSLVFIAIFFGMVFAAGVRLHLLFGIFAAGLLMMPIMWNFLKDYQKMRLMVFLDPNVDPLGSGYHIIQSKIAIGSGMLWGKGLFEGTQSQLNFLPENHTDFIFAVVGEELGFIGAAVLLLLYLIILWRGIVIALKANDIFGRFLAVGVTSMFAFHILVNVGMTTGIMPVTGIPLPFMSYGVSSLTTNFLAVGLLLNIKLREQKFSF